MIRQTIMYSNSDDWLYFYPRIMTEKGCLLTRMWFDCAFDAFEFSVEIENGIQVRVTKLLRIQDWTKLIGYCRLSLYKSHSFVLSNFPCIIYMVFGCILIVWLVRFMYWVISLILILNSAFDSGEVRTKHVFFIMQHES